MPSRHLFFRSWSYISSINIDWYLIVGYFINVFSSCELLSSRKPNSLFPPSMVLIRRATESYPSSHPAYPLIWPSSSFLTYIWSFFFLHRLPASIPPRSFPANAAVTRTLGFCIYAGGHLIGYANVGWVLKIDGKPLFSLCSVHKTFDRLQSWIWSAPWLIWRCL